MIGWLKRKLLRNLGEWNGVVRSGQAGAWHRWLIWLFYRPKAVLNLAHSPDHDPQDRAEEDFCDRRGILYVGLAWGSSGPHDPDAHRRAAVMVLNFTEKHGDRVWIHCEGGQDRTGGLVGLIRVMEGYDLEAICDDWALYGTPNTGWAVFVFEEWKRARG